MLDGKVRLLDPVSAAWNTVARFDDYEGAQRARGCGAAPGEPARHPFDEPQVGSDNVQFLDREAVVERWSTAR